MDDAPGAPSIYDDEFNAGSLDPKWTSVTGIIDPINTIHPFALVATRTRVSFNSYRKSWMMVQPPANVPFGIYQTGTLPTDYCVWARMSFNTRYNAVSNNDADLAIHLLADNGGVPDTNNLIYMNLNESDANQNFARNGRIVAGVSTIASTTRNVGPQTAGLDSLMQNACYILIQKIGTTYHCALGEPSGNWMWLTSQTVAAFTPAWIGLVFGNVVSSGNGAGTMIMGVDFLRLISGKALP